MRAEWNGLNVQPGDRVRSRPHGVGIVGGSLYRGHRAPQVRLIRRANGGGPIVVGDGALEVLAAAPVFEVGEDTPLGPVVERWERDDAPGWMYSIQIGTDSGDGTARTTVVGPEKLQTLEEA